MSIVNAIVHINTKCQSKCITCDWWKKSEHNNLSVNDIEYLCNEFKKIGIDQIMLSGGEPLLHPQIYEIVKVIKQNNIFIMLNTNGIPINKTQEELFAMTDLLVVSMDATNPDTYMKIRGVNAFNHVIENVKEVIKRNLCTVSLRCTIQRHNLMEVLKIDELGNELGIGVGFNPVDGTTSNFGRESKSVADIELIPNSHEIKEFREMINKSEHLSKYGNIQNNNTPWNKEKFNLLSNYFESMWCEKPMDMGIEPCIIPYSGIVIEANGDVKSCFYHTVGNIHSGFDFEAYSYKDSIKELTEQMKKERKCACCRCKIFC